MCVQHAIGASLVALTVGLNGPSIPTLDVPVEGTFRVLHPLRHSQCQFWTAVEQLARRVRVRVGLENAPGCVHGPYTLSAGDDPLDLAGMTARQGFERLIAFYPAYRWQERDGIVVIRPTLAWDDPNNPLNRPVRAFDVQNVHLHEALHMLLDAATPSLFWPHTDFKLSSNGRMHADPSATAPIDRRVSVSFPGGTVLDALDAVTKAQGRANWQVGYTGRRARITLSDLDLFPWGGSTGITTAPFSAPLPYD